MKIKKKSYYSILFSKKIRTPDKEVLVLSNELLIYTGYVLVIFIPSATIVDHGIFLVSLEYFLSDQFFLNYLLNIVLLFPFYLIDFYFYWKCSDVRFFNKVVAG